MNKRIFSLFYLLGLCFFCVLFYSCKKHHDIAAPTSTRKLTLVTCDELPNYFDSLYYDDKERLIREARSDEFTIYTYTANTIKIAQFGKPLNNTIIDLTAQINKQGLVSSAAGVVNYGTAYNATVAYSYDANGYLTSELWNVGSVGPQEYNYTYSNGNLIQATVTVASNNFGKFVYTYDETKKDHTGVDTYKLSPFYLPSGFWGKANTNWKSKYLHYDSQGTMDAGGDFQSETNAEGDVIKSRIQYTNNIAKTYRYQYTN